MDKCINTKHPEFIKLAKQVNMNPLILKSKIGVWQEKNNSDDFPTLEELGSNNNNNIKEGVAELFESNPELANEVYEALGYKTSITQDNKSYYRGQVEKPTIDKNGNLVLHAKEDELYKKAGLKSKGVSMTDNLQSAIEYGNGQLDVSKNLASEENIGIDLERELYRLDENGYYLIQIPKNISNEIVKEAGEVKVIGDKIIIPKGQYRIEQVVDGVETQITQEQKQQAQQLYSSYIQTTNNPTIEGFKQWNNKQQQINELFESNPELANEVYSAMGLTTINESEITYTDEEGNPCAKMGGRSSKFTKGSKWEIVKDLKGYPSHAQGGVDIKLGKNGFSFTRNNGVIEAKHGLVLPKIK